MDLEGFGDWVLTLRSDHRDIFESLWLTDSGIHRAQFTETMYTVSSRAHTPRLGRHAVWGQGSGSVPRQCSGSPINQFLVIALSFLVFGSPPLGLLKVPQQGLRCGPELDKFPLVPAELLSPTQPGPSRRS